MQLHEAADPPDRGKASASVRVGRSPYQARAREGRLLSWSRALVPCRRPTSGLGVRAWGCATPRPGARLGAAARAPGEQRGGSAVPVALCPGPTQHRPGRTAPEPSPALPRGLPWVKTPLTSEPQAERTLCSAGDDLRLSGSPRRCRPSTSQCLTALNKEGAIRAPGIRPGRSGVHPGTLQVPRSPDPGPYDQTAQDLDIEKLGTGRKELWKRLGTTFSVILKSFLKSLSPFGFGSRVFSRFLWDCFNA